MRKIAKFESDLLKTYEDIAPQNCVPPSIQTSVKFLDLDCENLQTFVWWGRASLCPPPPLQTSVKFLDLDCENL